MPTFFLDPISPRAYAKPSSTLLQIQSPKLVKKDRKYKQSLVRVRGTGANMTRRVFIPEYRTSTAVCFPALDLASYKEMGVFKPIHSCNRTFRHRIVQMLATRENLRLPPVVFMDNNISHFVIACLIHDNHAITLFKIRVITWNAVEHT